MCKSFCCTFTVRDSNAKLRSLILMNALLPRSCSHTCISQYWRWPRWFPVPSLVSEQYALVWGGRSSSSSCSSLDGGAMFRAKNAASHDEDEVSQGCQKAAEMLPCFPRNMQPTRRRCISEANASLALHWSWPVWLGPTDHRYYPFHAVGETYGLHFHIHLLNVYIWSEILFTLALLITLTSLIVVTFPTSSEILRVQVLDYIWYTLNAVSMSKQ
jgi:hypothetical protein